MVVREDLCQEWSLRGYLEDKMKRSQLYQMEGRYFQEDENTIVLVRKKQGLKKESQRA